MSPARWLGRVGRGSRLFAGGPWPSDGQIGGRGGFLDVLVVEGGGGGKGMVLLGERCGLLEGIMVHSPRGTVRFRYAIALRQ